MPLTAHARRRSSCRNLRHAEIEYVIANGRPLQRTGATFYFLARRDVPHRDLRWAARLIGAIVVVAHDGEVITVYRNRAGLPTIRRKVKYRLVPALMRWDDTRAEVAELAEMSAEAS
jgi:hypothetical protein